MRVQFHIFCMKETVLSQRVFLAPLLNMSWLYLWGLNSGLSILFHWCVPISMLIPQFFNYYRFLEQFEIMKSGASDLVLPSQGCFDYLRSLVVPLKFWDSFFYFCKECRQTSDGLCYIQVALDSMDTFTILILPILSPSPGCLQYSFLISFDSFMIYLGEDLLALRQQVGLIVSELECLSLPPSLGSFQLLFNFLPLFLFFSFRSPDYSMGFPSE